MTDLADLTPTGICNLALSAAEVPSVLVNVETETNSKAARVCRLHFAKSRQSVLRNFAFSFSQAWQPIAEQSPAPVAGRFRHAFTLPATCLRVVRVEGVNKRDWRPAGQHVLLVCRAGPLNALLVEDKPVLTEWDALAIDLLVLDLAQRIAPELTHLQGLRDRLERQYKDIAFLAPKLDAFEADSEEDDADFETYVPESIAVRYT